MDGTCRTCAKRFSTSSDLVSLFSIANLPKQALSLDIIYTKTTGLQINSNDDFPLQICSICLKLLLQAYTFIDICQESYLKFESQLPQAKEDTSDEETPPNDAKESKNARISGKNAGSVFMCRFCGKAFSRKSMLIRHIKLHTDTNEYECSICSKAFSQPVYAAKHMSVTHSERRSFACPACPKAYKAPHNLKRHMLKEHNLARPARPPARHACAVCAKVLPSPAALAVHKRRHTGERPYACLVCQRTFISVAALKKHEEVHTDAKPFVCKVCGKEFRRKSHLQYHFKTHRGEVKAASKKEGALLRIGGGANVPILPKGVNWTLLKETVAGNTPVLGVVVKTD